MVLCDELSKDAQVWADRGVFEHCKERNGAGENIGKFLFFCFFFQIFDKIASLDI